MTGIQYMNKAQLRKEIGERRLQLSAADIIDSNEKIATAVINLPQFEQADNIFCYVSMSEEVETFSLIEQIWKTGRRVAVPRCSGNGIMHAYAISGYHDLEKGYYGILEPKLECTIIDPREIDFAIIPCISCDPFGVRLGHGGGYYDRYLVGKTYPAAALCREQLLSEQIPCEEWDLKMDLVITEKRVITIV